MLDHNKVFREDSTTVDKKYVAEATRRRRKILLAGFFFIRQFKIICIYLAFFEYFVLLFNT